MGVVRRTSRVLTLDPDTIFIDVRLGITGAGDVNVRAFLGHGRFHLNHLKNIGRRTYRH